MVVVTGDVPLGASRDEALAAVRLVGLTNDVSLRNLIPDELAKGFGFFQSKPASAFSPVFVTPDALGDWWKDGKLHRKLMVDLNGQPFGRAEAGEDMTTRRFASNRSAHSTALAMPVSSSSVTNTTPLALPGRWRTRMRPATSTRAPSFRFIRSAHLAIRRAASRSRRKVTGCARRLSWVAR